MRIGCTLILLVLWSPIWGMTAAGTSLILEREATDGRVTAKQGGDIAQEEAGSVSSDAGPESATAEGAIVGDTLDFTPQVANDTTEATAGAESQADTVESPQMEVVSLALDAGYKAVAWGTTQDPFSQKIKADTIIFSDTRDAATISGILGEDTVSFTYHFSDKGFWKVRIDYQVDEETLEDYIHHFSRLEKFLSKRYGSPTRTTQNEMGTDREYLFSDFPKLSRAYFRSSWAVEDVRIELLLEALVPERDQELPVFEDVAPMLRLHYYHPDFYKKSEPARTEIPEETLLDAY